jgi:pilus assembly protein CpaE
MSRTALIVGHAEGGDTALEDILQRHGYSRLTRLPSIAQALASLEEQHAELLLVPIDEVDELHLAAIDRLSRRERQMGIIASGQRAEPELMLRAMRAGIQEFLVRPIDPIEFTAAVERLGRRTTGAVSNGQVYAVFGSKGGVGTSTVAVNLAHALTVLHRESRVAVADLAIPGGDIRLLLNVRPAYDIGDIAGKVDRIDADLLHSVMVPSTGDIWVLAAPERPEAEEEVDATVSATIVKQLRNAFAYTVLDCEHRLNDRTLAALDAADRIILLTELKVPALRAAQRMLGVFRRLGYQNDKLAVVVNRYQSVDVVTPNEAAEVLKADIYFRLPNDYPSCSRASTDGVPIGVMFPQSKMAAAYQRLAQQVSGADAEAIPESGVNGSRKSLRHLFSRKRS